MNNLGMIAVLQKAFAEARDWFQKSMLLNREVGDAWMVALCHNNLGNATRGLGDYETARRHYADSLRAYRDYDDRWALAFLLEDIGILAALGGDARIGARTDRRRRCVARGDRRAARAVAARRRSGSSSPRQWRAVRSRTAWRIERAGGRSISPPPSTAPSRSARVREGATRPRSRRRPCRVFVRVPVGGRHRHCERQPSRSVLRRTCK